MRAEGTILGGTQTQQTRRSSRNRSEALKRGSHLVDEAATDPHIEAIEVDGAATARIQLPAAARDASDQNGNDQIGIRWCSQMVKW